MDSAAGHPEEQVGDDPGSPWWGEHRSRYRFAARHDLGDVVVDIACGSGLGAAVVADRSRVVLGFDLSWEAVQAAARTPDRRYLVAQASGLKLPLEDACASAVLSFETIEHLTEPQAFVGELRRVLRDDGLLVLSTPNALFTRPVDGIPSNPFHIREFAPDELADTLAPHFSEVELLGQRTSPDYGPCPFWELPGRPHPSITERAVSTAWKVLARLPAATREPLSLRLLDRSFYPGESDFSFSPDAVADGHVLVAVCRP